MPSIHTPVLLQEVIEGLSLQEKETLLDGTFGGGGHSREARSRVKDLRIIALDRDPSVRAANPDFEVYIESFRNLDKVLHEARVEKVDAILFDLGISSDQIDVSGRGFSFLRDEPLDMRMSDEGPTAADILNTFPEETLELILRGFGEEKYSRKISKAIIEAREKKPFKTTFDLVEVVKNAVPPNYERGRINPATRTFQALRITTNDELTALEEGLNKGWEALREGGRLAVISFHSLEDRIVKHFFREHGGKGKPIVPSEEEMEANPRSRSAKLRILEKKPDTNDKKQKYDI